MNETARALAELALDFPFRRILTWPGRRRVGAVALNAPFGSARDRQLFEELRRRKVHIMGFTHYQEFPGVIPNPHESRRYAEGQTFDYANAVDSWGTCFRNPSAMGVPISKPQLQLSESDMINPAEFEQFRGSARKLFDYAYVCLGDSQRGERCVSGWQSYCRNWPFATRAIEALSASGFRGLLLGRAGCTTHLSATARRQTVATRRLTRYHFLRRLATCRVLLVTAVHDASPRILAEGLLLGHAILLNSRILGGWKYMRPDAGEFFDDTENDAVGHIVRAMGLLVNRSVRGMIDTSFYTREYGREQSGLRMARFLRGQGVSWEGPDKRLWLEPG